MKYRKAVTSEIQDRYIKATKKGKTKILDEFCATTGYNRAYAAGPMQQEYLSVKNQNGCPISPEYPLHLLLLTCL